MSVEALVLSLRREVAVLRQRVAALEEGHRVGQHSVLAYVAAHEPCSFRAIVTGLAHLPRNTVANAISRLVHRGKLSRCGPKGRSLYSLSRSSQDGTDPRPASPCVTRAGTRGTPTRPNSLEDNDGPERS